MPRIEWSESFSVGVAEIDEQHRRWVELINKLHDAIMDKKVSPEMTDKILSEMIDYSHFHFAFGFCCCLAVSIGFLPWRN